MANLLGIQANSAVLFYYQIIAVICYLEQELHEYFGSYRKDKCGRDAEEKVAVFGILQRGRKVYRLFLTPKYQ